MIYNLLPRPFQLLIDVFFAGVLVVVMWWIVSNATMTTTERTALHELRAQLAAEHPELRCKIALLTRDGNIVTCTDGKGHFVIKAKP